MNEMRLYTGFMNGVTSLFVPNLCSEQDNNVSGALPPPTKRKVKLYTVHTCIYWECILLKNMVKYFIISFIS